MLDADSKILILIVIVIVIVIFQFLIPEIEMADKNVRPPLSPLPTPPLHHSITAFPHLSTTPSLHS